MFLNVGHFSASRSYKKVLFIKKECILFHTRNEASVCASVKSRHNWTQFNQASVFASVDTIIVLLLHIIFILSLGTDH